MYTTYYGQLTLTEEETEKLIKHDETLVGLFHLNKIGDVELSDSVDGHGETWVEWKSDDVVSINKVSVSMRAAVQRILNIPDPVLCPSCDAEMELHIDTITTRVFENKEKLGWKFKDRTEFTGSPNALLRCTECNTEEDPYNYGINVQEIVEGYV